MHPEWIYHFLVGCNQFGSPVIVAFCVSGYGNCVVIMPLSKIHPDSMPNAYLPLKPTSLGRIVTVESLLTHKEDARVIWDALCNDTQYRMRPTEFEKEYPGKKFNLKSDVPIIRKWNYATDSYDCTTEEKHNTNYALEA